MVIQISLLWNHNNKLVKIYHITVGDFSKKELLLMKTNAVSEDWNDLVQELKQLETFFPMLGISGERDELHDEVLELEELITAAGIPEDEHSQRALTYLRSELTKKRGFLSKLA